MKIKKILNLLFEFYLFLFTLSGIIPSHFIRLLLYRYIFGFKIGKNSYIHMGAKTYYPWGISIGNNTAIGGNAFLDGRKGIKIGNNVSIGQEIHIYNMEHDV